MSKLRGQGGLGWVGHPLQVLEGFFNILQTQVFLVAWADWNVKCHVSNESVLVSLSLRSEEVLDGRVSSRLSLAAVRRRLSQFSSLSRCGPKKFSTAESVIVSLSLQHHSTGLLAATASSPSPLSMEPERFFFSRVTCLTELELQPPTRRFIFRTRDMITPSRGFLDAVFSDTTEEGRHLLTEAYTDRHLQQCPHADMKPPVSLSSLFEVMQFCVRRGHNLFHNGAGKVFMYEVLKLKHYVPQYGRRWLSTTTNPKTDWCGFVDGGVRGVVDIQVETEEGKVLGLGEVKGEGEGRYQVLAAMQAYRERTGTWPVVGFVADSETQQLMEPQEWGGTHVTVQHTRFTTAKFDHLMSFVEQLVTALSVDIEPQMASLSLGEDAISILARMDKLEKTIEDDRAMVGGRLQNIEQYLKTIEDDRAMVGGRLQNIEESLKNLERMTNPPQPPLPA